MRRIYRMYLLCKRFLLHYTGRCRRGLGPALAVGAMGALWILTKPLEDIRDALRDIRDTIREYLEKRD